MTLIFYPFGIVRKRDTQHGTEETLISPEQLRQVLSDEGEIGWSTGLIQPDLLHVSRRGSRQLTVSFRNAQKTGVWLDGEDEPIRLPLPPLVLFKVSKLGEPVEYRMFAVKRRPRTGDEPLWITPLPNIYRDGKICWGSVARPHTDDHSTDMEPDWNMLLGSGFNNHATGDKSKTFDDIRKALRYVESQGDKRYPLHDLLPATPRSSEQQKTYADVIEELE